MRSECNNETFAPWELSLSILLSLSMIVGLIISTSFELTNFDDRTIGIAVSSGVDAASRTELYVVSTVLFFILSFSNLLILHSFSRSLRKRINLQDIITEEEILSHLSLFSIASLIFFVLSTQSIFLHIRNILFLFIVLTLSLMIIKSVAFSTKKAEIYSLFSDYNIIALSMSLPLPVIFIYWVVSGNEFALTMDVTLIYILSWLLFFPIYGSIVKQADRLGIEKSKLDGILIVSSIPAILIPISIPLANELQFTLSARWAASPQSFSAGANILLIISSLFLFFYHVEKRRVSIDGSRIVEYVYAPIFIATLALYKSYNHNLVIDHYVDLFHIGEELLPTQQVFSFGSVPFIDIFPSHGFTSLLHQLFYSLVNGYRPVEPILWYWIPYMFSIVILYLILKEISDPLFSFLAVTAFPILNIVIGLYPYEYYFIHLLPAVALVWLVRKISLVRFTVYWLLIISMVFWRLEVGLSAILSSIFIFSVMNIANFLLCNSGARARLKETAASFMLAASCISILFLVFVVLGGGSVKGLASLYLRFITYQASVQSHEWLYPAYTPLVVFQLCIQPLIAIMYMAHFIYTTILKKQVLKPAQTMLVFIATFSLILSIRATQRHGPMEGFSTYYFILLALSLPFYLNRGKMLQSKILFMLGAISFLFVFPSFNLLLKEGNLFTFHQWIDGERRVFDNRSQYEHVVSFLNENLEGEQTFFDFTNSPLLHVMANRRFVPFLIPNIYHTSETIQRILLVDLAEEYQSESIPFVVFKQGNWWDNVDGVPNEVRSYRIAEFIYTNYRPLGNVDNFEIWQANNNARDLFMEENVHYELNLKSEELEGHEITRMDGENLRIESGDFDPYFWNFLDLKDVDLDAKSAWVLRIIYKSSREGLLQVFFDFNGEGMNEHDSSTVEVIGVNHYSQIFVPIPVTYGRGNITDVRFDPPDSAVFEIKQVEILENDLMTQIEEYSAQRFSLRKLPYVWGTFDDDHPEVNTRTLMTLSIKSTPLIIGKESISLSLESGVDKSSGNYIHFRMKSEKNAQITMSYGGRQSSFTFDVMASNTVMDYLVRLSSQWAWMNEDVRSISLRATEPVQVEGIFIRKGD